MTSTLTVICDRCGEIVISGRTLLKVECGPLRAHADTLDICEYCASSLSSWLRHREAAVALAQPALVKP
jgi:hypothetical protein